MLRSPKPDSMANVKLKEIKKVYDKNVVAVQNFNLDITDKEFVVLVGPSGCGKSTVLRMVAGLEEISDGQVLIEDKIVNSVAPKDRDIAMVFQNYALYPHMTIYENLAFSLKLRKVKKDEIDKKVYEAADTLGIKELLQRKPKELSGGQRQRVAIGRAIVRHPKVFLMDEPLSNLDAKLRNQMRAELIKLHKQVNTTFIYVTHDQIEAMTLGERIVVMKDGLIQQIGTPHEVFNKPANLFVAGFIGSPQMNFFPVKVTKSGDQYELNLYGIKLEPTPEQARALREKEPGDVILGVRPEHLKVVPDGTPNSIKARLIVSEMMGSEMYLHTEIEGKTTVIRASNLELSELAIEEMKGTEKKPHVEIEGNKAFIQTSTLELVDMIRGKSDIYVTIPCNCTHLFDAQTEIRI